MTLPLVSVIVVNYNGERYLKKCIEAIASNDYKNIELIIVDNASNDGSARVIDELRQFYDNIRLNCIFLKKNYGPNTARNIGLKNSHGEFCLFIDHDAIINRNAISLMVSFLIKEPQIGAVQAKLLLMHNPEILDTCGTYLTPLGFVCEPDSGKKASTINDCKPILGGRGCFMIKRSVFKEIGPFNESFFLGWDETELFLRIWLRGYKVFSLPIATALHARSSQRGLNVEGLINAYKVFIRCFEFRNMIKISVLYSIALVYLILKQTTFHKNFLQKLYNEIRRFLSDFSALLVERKVIQLSVRKVSDADYMRYVMAKLTLSDMRYRFKRAFEYA